VRHLFKAAQKKVCNVPFSLFFFLLLFISYKNPTMAPIDNTPVDPNAPVQKKPISYKNLLLGASKSAFFLHKFPFFYL
jgi:hypothetical protein